jgi:hypothetical protein
MNISEKLESQVKRYIQTRSFALDIPMKRELEQIHKDYGHGKVNLGCSTCLRSAMQRVAKIYQEIPKEKPKLHFVGVKQKTMKELRAEAKERGIKVPFGIKKAELIELLKNG